MVHKTTCVVLYKPVYSSFAIKYVNKNLTTREGKATIPLETKNQCRSCECTQLQIL